METSYSLIANPAYQSKHILKRLISHHTGRSMDEIIQYYDTPLSGEITTKILTDYDDFAVRHKPIEYIVGYCEFFSRKFLVTPDTLIPRAETEYMITSVRDYLSQIDFSYTLYDIGTGSGILGVSVFIESGMQANSVIMTDISPLCLNVATQNMHTHVPSSFHKHFSLIHSDMLAFLDDKNSELTQHHVFVTNLPYIPNQSFYESDELSVREREPHIAFVAGDDGLDLYRLFLQQRIARKEKNKTQSICFCEMMTWQAAILAAEFPQTKQTICHTFHANIIIVQISF